MLLTAVEELVEVLDAAGAVDVAPVLILLLVLEGRGSVPVRVTPYKKKKFKLYLTYIWSRSHTAAAQRARAVAIALVRSVPVQALTMQLVMLATTAWLLHMQASSVGEQPPRLALDMQPVAQPEEVKYVISQLYNGTRTPEVLKHTRESLAGKQARSRNGSDQRNNDRNRETHYRWSILAIRSGKGYDGHMTAGPGTAVQDLRAEWDFACTWQAHF